MKTKMIERVDEEDGQGHMHLLGVPQKKCAEMQILLHMPLIAV